MITEVETKNYHAHKHTKVEFCDGVNIITGASDAGKSSLLRSIIWNITNRPMGDEVKNWDCSEKDETTCRITMPEGSITKKRQEGKVIYDLVTKDSQATFEAFKTDIPEEVIKLFDFSEFNYQAQHSPYFLLKETPGAVATKLNDLVGLSIIDIMFKNLNSKATENKRNAEEENKKAKKLDEEIAGLAYIDNLEKDLKTIENLILVHDAKSAKIIKLISLIDAYESAEQKIKEYWLVTRQENEVKNLLEKIKLYQSRRARLNILQTFIVSLVEYENKIAKYKQISKLEKDARSLQNKLSQYIEQKNRLCKLTKIVKSLKESEEFINSEKEWLSVEQDFISLNNKLDIFHAKRNRIIKLNQIISANADIMNKEDTTKKILTALLSDKKELLRKAGLCPLCKNKIDLEDIERILLET